MDGSSKDVSSCSDDIHETIVMMEGKGYTVASIALPTNSWNVHIYFALRCLVLFPVVKGLCNG